MSSGHKKRKGAAATVPCALARWHARLPAAPAALKAIHPPLLHRPRAPLGCESIPAGRNSCRGMEAWSADCAAFPCRGAPADARDGLLMDISH